MKYLFNTKIWFGKKILVFYISFSFFIFNNSFAQLTTLTEDFNIITVSSSDLTIKINKNPWYISIYNKYDDFICGEKENNVFIHGDYYITSYQSYDSLGFDTIVKRDPPFYHLYDESVIIGETYKFHCNTSQAKTAIVYLTFRNPYVFSVWMTIPDSVETVEHSFVSSEDEHFFGLGECWDAQSLDLKGLSVTMQNRIGTPDQGGYIPFYISTKGYGILVDNNLNVNFDFIDDNEVTVTAPPISQSDDSAGYFYGSSFLWSFYYGPNLFDVIDRFTEHVSKPALPPSWAIFTTWQWRDTNTETDVYADANGMRNQNIPCGLIWIDRPWAQGASNMPPPFEWEVTRYPNGSRMCHDLQDMGYKTGVWVARNLYGSFSDSTNYTKLKNDTKNFIERDNCQMYKIDRGNVQSSDPLFTCQAYFEAWNDVLHGDFVTLPRTIANRAQQYVSGKWPGDNSNTFEYPSGLKANIAVMLNLGICGFPFWGDDTGGFPDPPGNNVTIRWAQFSSFCTLFETAGTPYNYSQEYRDIYRQYAELYTRLFPYRWTYARIAHEKGHPVNRALALQYPQDTEGYNQKYEYLHGDWILVAPIVHDSSSRDVYLPEGLWYDWWSGAEYEGPTTLNDYPALQDKLPLFIKSGAIIPLIKVNQTWKDVYLDTLTFRVFPYTGSSFTILGDTIVYYGKTKPYTDLHTLSVACEKTDDEITITTDTSSKYFIFKVHEKVIPDSVYHNSNKVPYYETEPEVITENGAWYYDTDPAGKIHIMAQAEHAATNTFTIFRDSMAAGYNTPPQVAFLHPSDGDTLLLDSLLIIEISATDLDGSVSGVELFIDGISYGSQSSVYQWTTDTLGKGYHMLCATATDDGGATNTDTITIKVSSSTLIQQQYENSLAFDIYPNPLTFSGTITFRFDQPSHVTITLIDILGHEIQTLVKDNYSAGLQNIDITRSDIKEGFYILRLIACGRVQTRYLIIE